MPTNGCYHGKRSNNHADYCDEEYYHLTVNLGNDRMIANPMFMVFLDTISSIAPTLVSWLIDRLVRTTHAYDS